MDIEWSFTAKQDLAEIFKYLMAKNILAACKTVETIEATVNLLANHPKLGRKSQKPDTRELVISDTNYIVIYQLLDTDIKIITIYHGKQDWQSRL